MALLTLSGLREIHISGDIAYAARQYWYATQDMEWLSSVGVDLLTGIADFYLSRSTTNADGTLSINDVIPPDEYQVLSSCRGIAVLVCVDD